MNSNLIPLPTCSFSLELVYLKKIMMGLGLLVIIVLVVAGIGVAIYLEGKD